MLALIAGGGGLPRRIADAQPTRPMICAYAGAAPDGLDPDMTFQLETFGTLLQAMAVRGVKQVCFCGSVTRPGFDPAKLDAATLPLVPQFQKALSCGDDGALRVLVEILENAGFSVVAAQDVAPDLLARPGLLGTLKPDAQMHIDATRANAVIAALAPLDVGQCCVVGQGQVFGIESIGGTDHLLATLPEAVRSASALLFKGPKLGQSRLVDMPTIGPATLEAAARAGLAGVVIEAGGVIVLEPDRCARLADDLGLVVWVRDVP